MGLVHSEFGEFGKAGTVHDCAHTRDNDNTNYSFDYKSFFIALCFEVYPTTSPDVNN